jgi:hypothetical protein
MSAGTTGDEPIYIVNEFASVRVRKIRTRNGERLEIAALTGGRKRRILLDALVLESLTWRSVLELGGGLQTPFGPLSGEQPGNGAPPPARASPQNSDPGGRQQDTAGRLPEQGAPSSRRRT